MATSRTAGHNHPMLAQRPRHSPCQQAMLACGPRPRPLPGSTSMGLFCVNLHLRSIDDTALAAALARRKVKHYRIAPAQGEWTSLYEERLSTQDDGWVRKLGTQLTRDLRTAAIA